MARRFTIAWVVAVSLVGSVLGVTAEPWALAVTAGSGAGTVLPELLGAVLGASTNSSTTPPFAESTVLFDFDGPVTGANPVAGDFHLVGFNANLRFDGQSAAVQSDGHSVLVTFGSASAPVGQQQILDSSIAAVSDGAVTDTSGETSPVGSVPVGAARSVTNQSGVTVAPDLSSVGHFASSTGSMSTTVEFVFDKPAYVTSGGGTPHLAMQDASTVNCSFTSGSGSGSGSGTATLTATCPNPAGSTFGLTPISASDVTRGYVDAESVSADPQNPSVSGPQGSVNVLQSADIPPAPVTPTPFLTGVVYAANVTVTDDTGRSVPADQVTYVFDQPVVVATSTSGSPACAVTVNTTAVPTGACFVLSTTDARQVSAANPTDTAPAVRGNPPTVINDASGKPTEVLVTFPAGTLVSVAGAGILPGAVTEASPSTVTNQGDGLGKAFPGSVTFTPGTTDGPLLTGVAINPDTNPIEVTYGFDRDLDPGSLTTTTTGEFFLLDADGTRLECQAATQASGGPTGANRTVTCTSYQVMVVKAGVLTPAGTASDTQITQAAVSTVDHGAVTTNHGLQNPEAARVVLAAPTVTSINPTITLPGLISGDHAVTINGTAAPNATVILWQRSYGTPSYLQAATSTADSTGAYSFYRWQDIQRSYYVVSGGVTSVTKLLQIRVVVHAGVTSPSRGSVVVHVVTGPPQGGRDLRIYRINTDNTLTPVFFGPLNSAGQIYVTLHNYPPGALEKFTAVVYAAPGLLNGASPAAGGFVHS